MPNLLGDLFELEIRTKVGAFTSISQLQQKNSWCKKFLMQKIPDAKKNIYLVWTQSIGFPTYCLVVTAIENVTNKITVALLCSRNTKESIVRLLIYKKIVCQQKIVCQKK